MQKRLSVQSLSVQKRDARFELRLPGDLKELIEKVARNKNNSASELTTLLWLDYLSKTGWIEGKVINKTEDELNEDVEHFLKNA